MESLVHGELVEETLDFALDDKRIVGDRVASGGIPTTQYFRCPAISICATLKRCGGLKGSI